MRKYHPFCRGQPRIYHIMMRNDQKHRHNSIQLYIRTSFLLHHSNNISFEFFLRRCSRRDSILDFSLRRCGHRAGILDFSCAGAAVATAFWTSPCAGAAVAPAFSASPVARSFFLYVLFLIPSSVDIPLKKGIEKGTMTPIGIYRPVSEPFFGGISTEEGF